MQIGNKYLLPILISVIVTVGIYIYMKYTKHGYEIAVVGESERTARYAGIRPGKVIIRTMLLSGGLCGFVGMLLVGGIHHTITTTITGGQGFTAVMVSWLAQFNPFTMMGVSLLIIFLSHGASEISTSCGLNQSFGEIITGIILFFIIGCEFFIQYKVIFRKKETENTKEGPAGQKEETGQDSAEKPENEAGNAKDDSEEKPENETTQEDEEVKS